MPVVGEGTIVIRADASPATRQMQASAGTFTRLGTATGDFFGKALKRSVQVSMAAVGAIVTVALVKGFQRLKAIDDARGKLLGLGHDAGTVQKIMDDALASVRGTAYGLGSAATIAAGAVAAGVKPGTDLQRTLKLVADTATIAGTSMEDVGSIFVKAAARGRVSGDELAQLTDRGIPALQFLAKEYGVTTAEASKMVSKGQVDFAHFQNALAKGLGGAAQEGGKTFSGAMANVGAALSRAGASILSSAFNQMPDIFATVITWVDKLTAASAPLGDKLGGALRAAWDALQRFVNSPAGQQFFASLLDTMRDLGTIMRTVVLPVIQRVGTVLAGMSFAGFTLLQTVLSWIADHGPLVADVLTAFVVIMGGMAAIIKVVTAVQWLWNAAMAANPLGLMVLALAAVVAGIVILWRNSETFRNAFILVWGSVWNFLKSVVAWFGSDFVSGIKSAWAAVVSGASWVWAQLRSIWNAIVTGFVWVRDRFLAIATAIYGFYRTWIAPVFQLFAAVVRWAWASTIRPVLDSIRSAWSAMANWLSSVWRSTINVVFSWVKIGFTSVGNLFRSVWNSYVKPVLDALRRNFDLVRSGFSIMHQYLAKWWGILAGQIRDHYNKTIKPVFDTFKRGVDTLKTAFALMATGVAQAWEKVKNAALAPVRFVINTVMNAGIIKNFNALAKVFGTKQLPEIKAGFASGGRTPRGRGIVGGVHEDEFVVRKKSRQRFERSNPGWLDFLNVHGFLPGYKGGGQVSYRGKTFTQAFAQAINMAENLAGGAFNIFQGGFRPATSYSGTSHRKDAIDYGPVNARNVRAARKSGIAAWDRTGMGNWVPHIHGVPLPGYGTAGGSAVWQALDYLRGGNGLGGRDNGAGSGYRPIPDKLAGAMVNIIGSVADVMINWTQKLADALAGPLGKLKTLGEDPFVLMLKGAVGKVVAEMKKKIYGTRPDETAGADSNISTAGVSGNNQQVGRTLLKRAGFGDDQWPPLQKLWTKESGWRTNAKNPGSGAYGIPQALPGSKMASAGADWRTSAATQVAWGLGYIRSRYKTPAAAWAHSQRTNWYDEGGMLPPGWSSVINATRKPEPVLTNAQWGTMQQIADSAASGGGDTYVTVNLSIDDVAKMSRLSDFLHVIDNARVNSRKTLRSGRVAA